MFSARTSLLLFGSVENMVGHCGEGWSFCLVGSKEGKLTESTMCFWWLPAVV